MKISEAPKCAKCEKKLLHAQHPLCYKVEVTPLVLDARAAMQTQGLTQMFGGALGLAEIMGADPEVLKEAREHKAVGYLCVPCHADVMHNVTLKDQQGPQV